MEFFPFFTGLKMIGTQPPEFSFLLLLHRQWILKEIFIQHPVEILNLAVW